MPPAFAVWMTGLPASGKSAIARALLRDLQARGLRPALLESDVLRTVITPQPAYDAAEREIFYGALVNLGAWLAQRGVPVLFDATANRRAWRDAARAAIVRFAEIHVDCPLTVCAARDPKGLYRSAAEGRTTSLPGVQAQYEPPHTPELTVHSDRSTPEAGAREILELLRARGWLDGSQRNPAAT